MPENMCLLLPTISSIKMQPRLLESPLKREESLLGMDLLTLKLLWTFYPISDTTFPWLIKMKEMRPEDMPLLET